MPHGSEDWWGRVELGEATFKRSNWGTNIPQGGVVTINYTVPSGKTLYICHLSASFMTTLALNGEAQQFGEGYIYDQTEGEYYANTGGNGGFVIDFSRPISFPQNHVILFTARNMSTHNQHIRLSVNGYET